MTIAVASPVGLLSLAALLLCLTLVKLLLDQKPHRGAHYSINDKGPLPGPKGLPFLGSVVELPRLGSWFVMKAWADRYGPLIEATLLGQRLILVGSHEVANRLLNGRGAIYSSRPGIASVVDSRSDHGTAEYVALMALNNDHTRHKKFGTGMLNIARTSSYYGVPLSEARRLVQRIGEQADDTTAWVLLTEEFTCKVACRLAFGNSADYVEMMRETWRLLYHISPAGFLAAMIRPLSKLPYWLSYWKQAEHARHVRQQALFSSKLQQTRQSIVAGVPTPPSYIKTYVVSRLRDPATSKPAAITNDREGAALAGILAFAAIYTTASPLQSFVRALAAFPAWQARLHAEMESVVPGIRLPELTDIPALPLLRACIREACRWRPPIPCGIPHELTQDDVVDGHHIKKGTPVLWVDYALCRDTIMYPRSFDFLPERWLDPAFPTTYSANGPKLVGSSMFGYGRRVCIGHELAQEEIYAACAHMVWAFTVKPTARGEQQLCENLGPGEGRGGMQVPQKWYQSLIIAKPEDLELVWEWRDQTRAAVAHAPGVLDSVGGDD